MRSRPAQSASVLKARRHAAMVLGYLYTRDAAIELLKLWPASGPEASEVEAAVGRSPYIDNRDRLHPVLK